MTMLANVTETRALTLADYEARIHLYKEQIGTGYIGIGRTLLEAKEAKVVPHGQWESWVTQTTGLTARQAQRCMQAATEIRDGSAMARLEMSKALLLLGSGLDEEAREEIAQKAGQEGATVKALKEEIRQTKLKLVQETGASAEIREALKKAEGEREDLEQQIRARETAYQQRLEEAREDAYKRGEQAGGADAAGEIRRLRADLEKNRQLRQSLQDRLDSAMRRADDQNSAARKIMLERDGIRNELNKQTQYANELKRMLDEREEEHQRMLAKCDEEAREEEREKLKRSQQEILDAAVLAEQRAADAEAELEALKAGGEGQTEPPWKTLKVALTRFMADCEMMPLDPAALVPYKTRIEAHLTRLERWTDYMRMALAGAVSGEGAVE